VETYQDAEKVRTSIASIAPVDYAKSCMEMISLIDSYKNMQM
jgi:hypothetical protein